MVNVLFAAQKQKLEMWASLVTTLVNVAGNVLLIPVFGAMGAAIASLICQVVAAIVLGGMIYRVVRPTLPIHRAMTILGLAIAALIASILLQQVMNWFLTGLIVSAAYLGLAFAAIGPYRKSILTWFSKPRAENP